MKLTEIVCIWDALVSQGRDLGDIGYCDLEKAIAEVCIIHNDIPGRQLVLAGQGRVMGELTPKQNLAEIRVIKSCLSALDPGLFWPVPTSLEELAEKTEIAMPLLEKLIDDNPDFARIVDRILADNKLLSRENAHA